MSYSKIILIGNLGRDPESRFTPDGTAVCSFPLAVNEKRKGGEDVTTWFDVSVWREKAEFAAKYLSKGQPVYIEGRFALEEYEDRNGNKRTKVKVTATEVQFVSSRND